jgi:hypothetical protein
MPKDMAGVMREFAQGKLHSGSSTGPVVRNRAQGVAIGLSEQRKMGQGSSHSKDKLTKALSGD